VTKEGAKKSLYSVLKKGAEYIAAISVVGAALWFILSPSIDKFLLEKMEQFHKHEGEVIRIGVLIRDGRELYLAPDGKEYSVIHGEDRTRWWYDGEQMQEIYK